MSIQHMQMVFDAGDLSGSEKAVLLAYCNHTDAHGYTWAGVERVADMTGFSAKTVKNVRKALKERNLLRSSARVERSGRRKTDISRINLTKLASLKLPPREYKDNVIAELEFEDEELPEATADQPRGTTCPQSDQSKGSSYPHQGKQVPLQEGEAGTPYPSGEPSCDPSSSSAELEDTAPVAEKKTKKITRKTAEDIVLERLVDFTPTLDEATAVVDLVRAQAAARGTRVERPVIYLEGRDLRVLAEDLEAVRRCSSKPGANTCALHSVSLESGACSSCMGDIKAGDAEAIRAHLLEVGADSRPDLVAVLGAPHVPAQATPGGWTWEEQLRRERRARNGVRGGSREPVPDHKYWEKVADLPQKEIAALLLGD
ncbi:helix-turn-helix domain-containing protein [Bacillus mobilis]